MSDLIVDFPLKSSSSCAKTKAKEVSFSAYSDLKYYESTNRERRSKLFYTSEEYQDMRFANREALRQVLLSSSTSSPDSADIAAAITGNEKALTPNIARKTMEAIVTCRRAVLNEQERQYNLGEQDPIKLARVSQEHSWKNSKRARQIGFFQSKL